MEDLSSLLQPEVADLGGTLKFAEAGVEPGSKGAGIDWNTLLLTGLASGGVAVSIINLISARLTQPSSIHLKKGKEEITITGKITPQQMELLNKFFNLSPKK